MNEKAIEETVKEMVSVLPYNWTGLTAYQMIEAGRIDKEGCASRLIASIEGMDEQELKARFPELDFYDENGEVDLDDDGKLMTFFRNIGNEIRKQIFAFDC